MTVRCSLGVMALLSSLLLALPLVALPGQEAEKAAKSAEKAEDKAAGKEEPGKEEPKEAAKPADSAPAGSAADKAAAGGGTAKAEKKEGDAARALKEARNAVGRAAKAAGKAELSAEELEALIKILDVKTTTKGSEDAKAKSGEEAKGKEAKKVKKAKAAEAEAKKDEAVEVKLDGSAPAAPAAVKAETKADEGKAEKAEAKAAIPPKKKEPQPPMFRLRDGTRLAGTPDLKALNVTTPYGKLVVPTSEVIRMRFASLQDTDISRRVEEHVKALGSEEFDRREEAMAGLREIGPPALEALRKALQSEDEEVKSRAEKLVAEIEEMVEEAADEDPSSSPVMGDEDEIVTLKFTVKGHVEEETFPLATRYGALKLHRKDIVSVVFQESPNVRQTFQVPGATFAAANKWIDTKLAVAQGERLHITATGQISLENYGQTTGPEGTTSISGNQLGSFPAGSLVGKMGDKGQPFLIGADFDGPANAAGTLFLGVSLQNGQIGGLFQVEVDKEGEAK